MLERVSLFTLVSVSTAQVLGVKYVGHCSGHCSQSKARSIFGYISSIENPLGMSLFRSPLKAIIGRPTELHMPDRKLTPATLDDVRERLAYALILAKGRLCHRSQGQGRRDRFDRCA